MSSYNGDHILSSVGTDAIFRYVLALKGIGSLGKGEMRGTPTRFQVQK